MEAVAAAGFSRNVLYMVLPVLTHFTVATVCGAGIQPQLFNEKLKADDAVLD